MTGTITSGAGCAGVGVGVTTRAGLPCWLDEIDSCFDCRAVLLFELMMSAVADFKIDNPKANNSKLRLFIPVLPK